MGLVTRLFNRFMRLCRIEGHPRPKNSPESLDKSVLEKVQREAEFLRDQQVDVRKLEEGESPGLPKRADQ